MIRPRLHQFIFFMVGALASFVLSPAILFATDVDQLKSGLVKLTSKTGEVGSGFIVRVDAGVVYIITAAHVIAGDQQPTVEFYSKTSFFHVLQYEMHATASRLDGKKYRLPSFRPVVVRNLSSYVSEVV